jgi:hypothetical protein
LIKLNRLSPYLFICLSVAFHLSLILIWAAYEGFIPVKPKDKNLDVIEVQLEEPIAKNNSDLNASFNSDKQLASLPVPSAPTAPSHRDGPTGRAPPPRLAGRAGN